MKWVESSHPTGRRQVSVALLLVVDDFFKKRCRRHYSIVDSDWAKNVLPLSTSFFHLLTSSFAITAITIHHLHQILPSFCSQQSHIVLSPTSQFYWHFGASTCSTISYLSSFSACRTVYVSSSDSISDCLSCYSGEPLVNRSKM